MSDVVVIGAGLAGLSAALRLRQAGLTVTLLTKGLGGIQLGQGTVDVLGYTPTRVNEPLQALDSFVADNPEHPYAVLGVEGVRTGVHWLADVLGAEQLTGSVDRNVLLPTAVGALRPTALVPPSMAAGAAEAGKKYCFVGIRQLKDFYPQLVADNLNRTELPDGGRVTARHAMIDFEARAEADSNALTIARALDDPAQRERFAKAVRAVVSEAETVGLPAVLGTTPELWKDLAERIGAPVFEVPLPPPSVPGIRQNTALVHAVKDARVRFVNGTRAFTARYEGDRLAGVTIEGTGHHQEYTADEFILATGGFESGGLLLDSHNTLSETVLGLPVHGGSVADMVHGDYWGHDQPLFKAGLRVDDQMRVLGTDGQVAHPNVRAAGGVLAGAQRWTEKSGEGIAVASAIRAADSIIAARAAAGTAAPRRGADTETDGGNR
ncbi:glycerol-3-phosphate dehydrogenase subunit GlpB [Luteococcus sanguinis]|uniref:Glycerol-3-phosphate dehydrogenase subunit GlpB n=1 Tax=Luteococcus sanguinis TaxID=174038 RepID=A0ABW1X1Z7_9ACTN